MHQVRSLKWHFPCVPVRVPPFCVPSKNIGFLGNQLVNQRFGNLGFCGYQHGYQCFRYQQKTAVSLLRGLLSSALLSSRKTAVFVVTPLGYTPLDTDKKPRFPCNHRHNLACNHRLETVALPVTGLVTGLVLQGEPKEKPAQWRAILVVLALFNE